MGKRENGKKMKKGKKGKAEKGEKWKIGICENGKREKIKIYVNIFLEMNQSLSKCSLSMELLRKNVDIVRCRNH